MITTGTLTITQLAGTITPDDFAKWLRGFLDAIDGAPTPEQLPQDHRQVVEGLDRPRCRLVEVSRRSLPCPYTPVYPPMVLPCPIDVQPFYPWSPLDYPYTIFYTTDNGTACCCHRRDRDSRRRVLGACPRGVR